MPRAIPSDRLSQLIAAATQVFIAQGYRRTQIEDVAQALGVAKGTIYGSVESKEAQYTNKRRIWNMCMVFHRYNTRMEEGSRWNQVSWMI